MSKKILEDMVKIKRATTRQNRLSGEPVKSVPTQEIQSANKNKSRNKLWFVALVSVMFFIFALSFVFSKAEIQVNPKTQDVILSAKLLSASKDTNEDNKLSFSLVVIEGEEKKVVQASQQKEISQKAEGKILIYNNFSSSSQKLNIDTRLEGSNGKIYKTKNAVAVPGKSKNNIPGSAEVSIYALEAGEEYNSAPLDFKIAGFKGTPKYVGFYARSKGEITGGSKGKFFVLTDSEKTNVINDLKTALEIKLFKKAADQIPNGFVLFKDAAYFDIKENNMEFNSKDNNLPVELKGALYGLIFDEKKLIKKIAQENIENYDDSDIFIQNIKNLTFSMHMDNVSISNIALIDNIDFNLLSTAKVVWKVDTDKLVADLLGKSKKDFNQILAQYPSISSANLSLSPFWQMSIPDKIKNIKVIVNYPK